MAMRCRWPPENSWGCRPSTWRPIPTWASSSTTRCSRSARPSEVWIRSGSPTISRMFWRGIERRVGVLEDHLHPLALPPQLRATQRREVDAAERDGPAGGVDQAHDQPGQRRLARAALADEPERRAGTDREVDAVDRVDRAGDPPQQAAPHAGTAWRGRSRRGAVRPVGPPVPFVEPASRSTWPTAPARASSSWRRHRLERFAGAVPRAGEFRGRACRPSPVGPSRRAPRPDRGRRPPQLDRRGHARIRRVGAAGMEAATGGELVGSRHHAGNEVQRLVRRESAGGWS